MKEFETKIRAARRGFEWGGDIVDLYYRKNEGSTFKYASDLVMVESKMGMSTHPFVSLDATQAQRLIDDLWDCGFRPSGGAGSAGALKATEDHLDSMRAIAYHTLKMIKPE